MSLRTSIHRHRQCRSGHLADLELFMIFVVQTCCCWTRLIYLVGLVLVERYTYGIDVGLMLFVIFVRRSVRYLCYYVIFVMDVPYIYYIACLECIYAFFVMMDVFFTLKTDKIQKNSKVCRVFLP